MAARLAALLLLAAAPSVASARATNAQVVTPDQLKWGPAPAGLPTAEEAAVVDGNPSQPGIYVVRLRLPDGTRIRPHWHSHDEHVTVLSGHFAVGMGDHWDAAQMTVLPAGGYASMPAGERHFAQARGESIVQVSGPGPFDIHYVNPSDDPRQQRSKR